MKGPFVNHTNSYRLLKTFILSNYHSNSNIHVQVLKKSHLKVLAWKESIESLQNEKFNSVANSLVEISVKRLRDVSTQSIIMVQMAGVISMKSYKKGISTASSKIDWLSQKDIIMEGKNIF